MDLKSTKATQPPCANCVCHKAEALKNHIPDQLGGAMVHISMTPAQFKQLRAELIKHRSKLLDKLIPREDSQMLTNLHYRLNPADWFLNHGR